MHPFIVPFGSTGYFHRDNHRISLNWISSNAWILAENIFLSTNAIRERSRTHNARHSSAEKSEGIIAPMVPHKGRICTSLLRQDRPERSPPCASPPFRRRDGGPHERMQSSLRAPQREAHAPQSHHPALPPRCRFLPPCIPWMRAPSPTNREED